MRHNHSRHLSNPFAGRAAQAPALARGRAGFTLAEALVSLGILTVLLVGMQSAIMLAGKAMPDANPLAVHVAEGRRAQDVVASDLAYATNILTRFDSDITFQVADRDGDNDPETIRFYIEDGSLVRVYNGVKSVVVRDVQDFKLTYGTRTVSRTESVTGEAEEANDRVLVLYTTAGTARDFALAPSALLPTEMKGWAAEYFKFSSPVPAGATKVRFTKVDLRLKGSLASLVDPTFGIYAATAGVTPTVGAALGSEGRLSRDTLNLSTYTDVTAALPSGVVSTTPANAFYLVVKGHDLLVPSAYLQYQSTGSTNTPHMEWSTNGGSTWQPGKANWNAQDLWFRVYGRYSFVSTVNTTTHTHYLTTVSMRLRTSTEQESQIDSAVQVFNEPLVSTP